MNATPAAMKRREMQVRADQVRVGDLVLARGVFRRVSHVSFGRNGNALRVAGEDWVILNPGGTVTVRRAGS